jgi:hypothetical protein
MSQSVVCFTTTHPSPRSFPIAATVNVATIAHDV